MRLENGYYILDTQCYYLYNLGVKRAYPTYHEDPLYWQPFWPNFVAVLKLRFRGFKVPRDMLLGACGAVGKTLCEVWLSIGSFADWQKHWIKVLIVTIVWSFSVLVGDALWRVIAALLEVRRKPRFKDISAVVIRTCIAAGLWGVVFWYDGYVRSPHFKLSIGWMMVYGGPWEQGTPGFQRVLLMGVDNDRRRPNTLIVFTNIALSNSGVISPARNWKLIVKPPYGDGALGDPEIQDGYIRDKQNPSKSMFTFTLQENIFYKTKDDPIEKTRIRGVAPFVVEGMMAEVASQPGTVLEVDCDDSKGHTYSATYTVPPIGETFSPVPR
jgi:hypothetical protein